jgi:hypothetical protein
VISKENKKGINLEEKNRSKEEAFDYLLPTSSEDSIKDFGLPEENIEKKGDQTNKILLKQIQKKEIENSKLDLAFKKLTERRMIISTALKQQRLIANMNRRKALLEIERQKTLLAGEDVVRLHNKNDKTGRKPHVGNQRVDKINQRIISRFQAIKKKRQQESSKFLEGEQSNYKKLPEEQY